MKLLLLGATGRTGSLLLEEALKDGHDVNCLVRAPERITIRNEQLKLVEGSPTQLADLEKALNGCVGLITALNISRTSDFPWARLKTPKTLLSDTMRNVVQLGEKHSLKRIITCSAWGVGETKKELPGWFRWFVDHSNIGAAYADHERQEEILRNSDLSWTIVRPSGLTNATDEQTIIESYNNHPKPKMTISRKSVARFMLNALSEERLIGKAPVISA